MTVESPMMAKTVIIQRCGQRFEPRNDCLHGVGNVPVDVPEPFRAERHFHRHARITERADLKVAQVLLEQIEAVKREEYRNVLAQRCRGRRENERWICPIECPLGGDDSHGRRFVCLHLGELLVQFLRQEFVDPLFDQLVQYGNVRCGAHGLYLFVSLCRIRDEWTLDHVRRTVGCGNWPALGVYGLLKSTGRSGADRSELGRHPISFS